MDTFYIVSVSIFVIVFNLIIVYYIMKNRKKKVKEEPIKKEETKELCYEQVDCHTRKVYDDFRR